MTNRAFRNTIRKVFFLTGALLSLFFITAFFPLTAYADDLQDSGIDYSDGRETVTVDGNVRDALYTNPYRGFHIWANPGVLKLTNDDSNTAVSPNSSARSLIYFPVDLSDFSGAYHPNADGTRGDDAELTQSALNALNETLENVRKNNKQVILRFVYDKGIDGIKDNEGCLIPDNEVVVPPDWWNSNRVVEPRQENILRHIEQLAPYLVENQDAIYTVQMGFYGGFGELHSTGMVSDENIAEAVDTMLKATAGSNLRISVRTPRRYVYYRFGKTGINQLNGDSTSEDEDAYRVAIYNDGYLSNDYDYGTFEDRETETNWMATQNLHNPYGGDAIPAPGGTKVGEPAKAPFVINEMFKVHTSYASADALLKDYWKNTGYDGSLYVDSQYAHPDSEYEGATLYEYIENHLGYRFVLRGSKLSGSVKKGGTLRSEFSIENVGFGNLFYPMKSYAYIVDKNGKTAAGPQEVDINPMDYKIGETTSDSMDINIPADIAPGEYDLYLQFKIGDREADGTAKPYGALRLANRDVWNQTLEANYMGSFTVDKDITITKKWDDETDASARPESLTFTIEKIAEQYQRVEYIEAYGTQWIDTGVQTDAAHALYSDGRAHNANANHLLQGFYDTKSRLGAKLYGGSGRLQYYWCLGNSGAVSTTVYEEDLGGIDVRKRFKMTQSASGISLTQENISKSFSYNGSEAGTTGSTWKIFYYNTNSEQAPRGFLYEAKILYRDEVLHHYVPCYRKSDGEIGVYDKIAKEFLTNAGTGTFEKGFDLEGDVLKEEVDDTPIELTIPKAEWSVDGNTWETAVTINSISGQLSIYEQDVACYESNATSDNKKEIDAENKVEITNTLLGHDWGTGTVTRKPTLAEDGIRTYTCAACGHTKTEAIPKLNPDVDPATEVYTITYDLNGGSLDGKTGTIATDYKEGTAIRLPKPVRDGYDFDYWEGSRYNAGDEYTVKADHTFTAQWKKKASGQDEGSGENTDGEQSGGSNEGADKEQGGNSNDGAGNKPAENSNAGNASTQPAGSPNANSVSSNPTEGSDDNDAGNAIAAESNDVRRSSGDAGMKTGDESNMLHMLLLLMISAVALSGMIMIRAKKDKALLLDSVEEEV